MARMLLPRLAALSLATLLAAGPAAALDLPFGLGGEAPRARIAAQPAAPAPVLMAQASDGGVRLTQMEEEMRRLTGKVEELSFLVLQLQEQLRKTQEDNEFRFQDLEKSGGGSSSATPQRRTDAAPLTDAPAAGAARVASVEPPVGTDATQTGSLSLPAASKPVPAAEPPAQADEIASILDTSLAEQAGTPTAAVPAPMAGSGKVASIATNGPVEMYSLGYNYMLAGDYHLAETTFRQYTQAYPTSEDAPDAQYWLGESLYAQAKYRDAAEVFLNAQKSYPKAGKAPEMMLKLGMSLAHLDNRETACVTYREVAKRYPQMSANVKRKLQVEEKSASCS